MRLLPAVLLLAACMSGGSSPGAGTAVPGASSSLPGANESGRFPATADAAPVDAAPADAAPPVADRPALSLPGAPDASWAALIAPRLAAVAHAPTADGDGRFRALIPEVGARAHFGAEGAHFSMAEASFTLRLASVGRGDELRPLPGAVAFAAPDPRHRDPADQPIEGVGLDREGLTEWWFGTPEGLEHAWTLDSPPEDCDAASGDEGPAGAASCGAGGPLRFELEIGGAYAHASGPDLDLVDAVGQTWHYGELTAWDAVGHPLRVAFELVEGDVPGAPRVEIVVDDRGATYPIDVDPILSTASTTLTGPSTSSYFGAAIDSAGDVNGDGYDDLIVGAPYAASAAGRAYVFHGSASGLSTTATTTLNSGTSAYFCGARVAGGGDTNGDGYDDVAISCTAAGAVYVYHGSSSGISSTASKTLTGSTSNLYGYGIALDGDGNGDGYADIAVGAPGQSSYKGRVTVYYGSSSGITTSDSDALDGPKASSYFGWAVAWGDVDADDYDDLAVGAPYYSSSTTTNTGRVQVFHGGSGGMDSTAATAFQGLAASTYLGYSLGSRGDVNGDGYDDVIVGSNTSTGVARIYHGSITGLSSAATTTITGSTGSYLGKGVAMVGDTDRDGYADVAVGAPGSGEAFLYAGSPAGVDTTAATSLSGTGSYFGLSLAGLDSNGDGYADLAVGDSLDSSLYGKVYIYLGYSDADGDGYQAGGTGADPDCDDSDPSTYPGATEIVGDGVDEDCDGAELCFDDADDDGYLDGAGATRVSADSDCTDPYEGADTDPTTDCDDGDASVNPGATEGLGDGVDSDCDGNEICYLDADNDGYLDGSGATVVSADEDCTDSGEGTNTDPTTDCDDTDASVYPGATEIPGDGIDQDCDGTELCYADADGDGYRTDSTVASTNIDCTGKGEALSTDADGDCDDGDDDVHPGATEVVGNEVDDDCDGSELCYADLDGDGVRTDDTVVSSDTDCDGAGEADDATIPGDCDDTDPSINPFATEVVGDEIDQNCDGDETCYIDADGDGYRTDETVESLSDLGCTDAGEARATDPDGDCDDSDASVYPGATETVGDEVDQDCDGTELCYADADGDGYRGSATVVSTDLDCSDEGEAPDDAGEDCDDSDASIHPGATEAVGDEVDQDCDGGELCYADADRDGYSDQAASPVVSADSDCADGGEASNSEPSGDCDDADPSRHPGATEVVGDEVDQDCDGAEVCYADADGDGYRSGSTVVSADEDCSDAGEAAVSVPADDCDDADAATHPGATEVVGDEVDQNCDGVERCYVDADDDGWRTSTEQYSTDTTCEGAGLATAADPDGDCDDADASVYPGATEVVGDGVDEDCDGGEICYVDADDDGYRPDDTSTVVSADADCDDSGEATAGDLTGDCDDSDPSYNPGATESDCADPNDYNCDGSTGYSDNDGDGWAACEDCDDGDASVNPDATEVPGDEIDQDCDGREDCFKDADGDGYRPDATSTIPSADADCGDGGEATAAEPTGDCDDADATVYPGATEVVGDEIDQDCDGMELCYVDNDDDGYRDGAGSVMSSADTDCTDPGEATVDDPGGDCNDGDIRFHPGAEENDCADPNDYNCDGSVGYEDADGDGFPACEDCDDSASAVNPAAEEVCNGIDDDCDAEIDEEAVDAVTLYVDADGDGYGDPGAPVTVCEGEEGFVADNTDCDDTDPSVHPGAAEVEGDGIDQDCDGADAGDTPGDTGDTGVADDSGSDSGADGPPSDTGGKRGGGIYGGCACDSEGSGAAGAVAGLVGLVLSVRRRLGGGAHGR